MTRRRAFTLVEVLLAVSLTAVVALAVAGLLATLSRAQERARERSVQRAMVSSIERQLAADLRALVPPGGLHAAGLIGESADDDGAGEDLAEGVTGADADGQAVIDARDRLVLSVQPPAPLFGSEPTEGEGALWEVTYSLDDDPLTDERGLLRQVARVRDLAPGVEAPPPGVLVEDAIGFDVAYFDGESWLESWDSGASDTLPVAIAVKVATRIGEAAVVVQVQVAPATARPTELQEAAP